MRSATRHATVTAAMPGSSLTRPEWCGHVPGSPRHAVDQPSPSRHTTASRGSSASLSCGHASMSVPVIGRPACTSKDRTMTPRRANSSATSSRCATTRSHVAFDQSRRDVGATTVAGCLIGYPFPTARHVHDDGDTAATDREEGHPKAGRSARVRRPRAGPTGPTVARPGREWTARPRTRRWGHRNRCAGGSDGRSSGRAR